MVLWSTFFTKKASVKSLSLGLWRTLGPGSNQDSRRVCSSPKIAKHWDKTWHVFSCCHLLSPCSPVAALQSLGVRWEAVIGFFHNYLYIIQGTGIRENIDFCQRLPCKPKQAQEFCCFPRWQEKSETSHCLFHCAFQLLLSSKTSYHAFTKQSTSPLAQPQISLSYP